MIMYKFLFDVAVDILGAIVKVEKLLHTSPIKNKFWDIKSETIIFFMIRGFFFFLQQTDYSITQT